MAAIKYAEAMEKAQREYLAGLLAACNYNASRAARRGGMNRPYLFKLMAKHGLKSGRMRRREGLDD